MTAEVACRDLGFASGAAFAQTITVPGADFALDDVYCLGNEPSISVCQYREYGEHNCGETEVVELTCGVEKNIELRLNGTDSGEGILEARLIRENGDNGEWMYGKVILEKFSD